MIHLYLLSLFTRGRQVVKKAKNLFTSQLLNGPKSYPFCDNCGNSMIQLIITIISCHQVHNQTFLGHFQIHRTFFKVCSLCFFLVEKRPSIKRVKLRNQKKEHCLLARRTVMAQLSFCLANLSQNQHRNCQEGGTPTPILLWQ